ELISDASPHCRLELPYKLPEEYDFQIVFTRQSGSNDVNQLLSHGGHSFMWMMNGMSTTAFGLDMVGGVRAGWNPTTVKLPPLQNGRKYTSLVQVRKNYVDAFLDGKQVGVWSTNYKDLYIMPEW